MCKSTFDLHKHHPAETATFVFVNWIDILRLVYAPLTMQDNSNAVQVLWG